MAGTPTGLLVAAAWADGVTRVHRVAGPGQAAGLLLELRLGSQVWALGVTEGRVVLGTADGVAALEF